MQIQITNAEAMNLYNALSNLNITGNAKFTYAIAKNKNLLKPHIEALQESAQQYAKDHPQLQEYQKDVEALLVKFAVDKDGKPVTRMSADGSTLTRVIPQEKQADYLAARQDLDDKYKDVLVGAQLHADSFASVLKELTDLKVHGIRLSDFPEGSINTQIMNIIFVLVVDEPAEVLPLKKKEEKAIDPVVA